MKNIEDSLEDPSMTLAAWAELIEELINIYGPTAIMHTDGGYNNVDLVIEEQN